LGKKKEPVEEKPVDIPLPNPDEATIICGVLKHLGGDFVLVKCLDGYDRKARIPGKIRKKVWIMGGRYCTRWFVESWIRQGRHHTQI